MYMDRAIVLRTYHDKNRYVLLDQIHGRRDIYMRKNVSHGSCIEYTIQQKWVTQCEVILMPDYVIQHDILFFHHVLEICTFFLMEQVGDAHLFALLMQLYTWSHHENTQQRKKMFLIKLLSLIGVYPEDAMISNKYILELSMKSLDSLCDISLNLDCEKKIDEWLWACVMGHPGAVHFRTAHFLRMNRRV